MLNDWTYYFVKLNKDFESLDDFDYSCSPDMARYTCEEDISLSKEPKMAKDNYFLASKIVQHFVWLKETGLLDYFSINRSMSYCEKIVDQEIQWETLQQSEKIKLIKTHLVDFKTICYPFESLQEKAGDTPICD